MRPQQDIRLCLAAALIDGGGTSRELARRIGAGREATRQTLGNMVRVGDAQITRMVRVPGVKRPVPFYERSLPAQVQQADLRCDALPSLIALWARPLAPAQEPTM